MSSLSAEQFAAGLSANAMKAFVPTIKIVESPAVFKYFLESQSKLYNKVSSGGLSLNREDPFMILVAGGIAAGKSTFGYNLVNYFHLENVPYIANDFVRFIQFPGIDEYESGQEMARESVDSLIDECIRNRCSFIWETILSSDKKIKIINRCRTNGYRLITFFLCVNKADISVYRARNRAKDIGFFLGEAFIRDRHERTTDMISHIDAISEKMIIVNNSDTPELLFYRDSKDFFDSQNS